MASSKDDLELDSVVRCGLGLAAQDRAGALAAARCAEPLGFDSLWASDHLAFHVPVPESLTLLAFAAAATQRIALGTAVYLVPLRHPVLIAKQAATLDALCEGRFVLGVGIGGEYPPEFDAVGVPVHERGARTDEAIPLLRRLWSERDVVHAGRFFRLGPVTIEPRPQRPGGPPIWVGGRAPRALRRAGRLGDGYISHMVSPEHYQANLATIAGHAREVGRGGRRFATAAFLFTALGSRFEDAHAAAAKALARVYARPFEDAARKYCLLGRPEDCLEQMRRFCRVGVRHFILSPLGDAEAFAERIASEVLPELAGLVC